MRELVYPTIFIFSWYCGGTLAITVQHSVAIECCAAVAENRKSSASVTKGYLARLDKMRGGQYKVLVCDDLDEKGLYLLGFASGIISIFLLPKLSRGLLLVQKVTFLYEQDITTRVLNFISFME